VKHIDPEHFPAQGDDETMGQFFSRLLVAYTRAQSELQHIRLEHRLPHPDTLIDLILAKARRTYTAQYHELLKNPFNPHSENDLTIEIVTKLYYEAARLADRKFPKTSQAARSPKKPAQQPPPAQKPTKEQKPSSSKPPTSTPTPRPPPPQGKTY